MKGRVQLLHIGGARALTGMPQSGPAQPGRHWHEPSVHTPWPEQELRSSQASMGCTVSDRHILQHCAGPIGTNSPVRVILLPAPQIL